MAAIVMDIDGIDIAHETMMLEEYGNEVGCAATPDVECHSVLMELIESVGLQRSTAFPQCP